MTVAQAPSPGAHGIGPAFFSVKQVAQYLNCSQKTILRLIADRKLSAKRLSRRFYRVSGDELKRFVDEADSSSSDKLSKKR